MLERNLARNRVGCIGCIPYRGRYDTAAKSEIHHSLLQVRVENERMKKMRAYRGLGRDRIGRTGPYRISAGLPIRGKYNRIGGFIGNYRKFRHENRALDEGGALAAAPSQAGASKRRRWAERRAICSVWLLEGREVAALTDETAAIRWPGGSVTVYRRNNKPALGPFHQGVGDD